MKSNSGITTTSLIIYIISMLIVIATIATITSFFFTNVMNLDQTSHNIGEITKFNMYFIEDIKSKNNKILKISENKNSITFLTGNTYTFQDNSIYLNNIRICENITNLQFDKKQEDNKTIIIVLITIGNNLPYTKITEYVMEN
ncbi:MAG: hypothetical protein HFJ53_05625 [Clostridia bacterium]|jgi:hypothetical protein|nr:hypothetical protein [Clostridia bacterium]